MNILKNILDLIFIPKCGACSVALPSSEKALCESCELKYQAEKNAKCGRCGYPRKYCNCTIKDAEAEIPFVHVTGYSTKRDSVSKSMILHAKDNALKTLLDEISLDMAQAFRFRGRVERSEDKQPDQSTVFDCVSENTLITWVPRSKRAYRKAGHDQALELAKRVSHELEFPIFTAFMNVGKAAQKKLNADERAENAEKSHVFIGSREEISGKNIIIVDDIVTTGASIKACAKQLVHAGAEKVIALTFAQTEAYREVYDDMPSVK